MGAEKLLGKGDMLYRHGTNNQRVHSAYVDEDEIEALTDKLANMPRSYHEGAMNFIENGGEESQDPYAFGSHISGGLSEPSSDEEYFRQAVQTVVEHRTASASMLQRRLKIGYNRAANLIEEMEAKGIVGPAEGSKRRKVLWSTEDLNSV
jgi:S-DNA-T family DNA segregation ATPase FtsK/SpoIIIE